MDDISLRFYITTRRHFDQVTVAYSAPGAYGEGTRGTEYLFMTIPAGLGASVMEQLLYDLETCSQRYKAENRHTEDV